MAKNFEKGTCCAGEHCKFPSLLLRPDSKCIKCGKIVHAVCANHVLNKNATAGEKKDILTCFLCHRTSPPPKATPPLTLPTALHLPIQFPLVSLPIVPAPVCTPAVGLPEVGLFCKKFDQEGHRRANSMLCLYFKPRKKKSKKTIMNLKYIMI